MTPPGDRPPVVGAVILRYHAGEEEVLLGTYAPDHPKEYLRRLISGPGGKLERAGRPHTFTGLGTCFLCGLPLDDVDCPDVRAPVVWEDPVSAALRETLEECGTADDLEAVAAESFSCAVPRHGFGDGVLVHAVLLRAGPGFRPREVPGERIGSWRWVSLRDLSASSGRYRALGFSPLSLLAMARLGVR